MSAAPRVRPAIISFCRQHWLFLVLVAQILFIAFASGYLLSSPLMPPR